jgi:hypothetical protein
MLRRGLFEQGVTVARMRRQVRVWGDLEVGELGEGGKDGKGGEDGKDGRV